MTSRSFLLSLLFTTLGIGTIARGYNFKEGAEGRGAAGARFGAEPASAGLSVAAEALQVVSGRAGALLCPAEAAGGAAAAAGTGAHQRRGCGASARSALPRGRSCTAAHH